MAGSTFVNALYKTSYSSFDTMNTGFLSNPAPSNGYDAVLGAMQAQAAPSEGSLGNFNPSVHNNVKSTFINPVASYPFLVAPWTRRYELGFHEGDLMFIYTGDGRKNASTRTVILANLPTLNGIIARGDENEYGTREHIPDWQFIGVMRNSAVAAGQRASHMNDSGRGGRRTSAERIINIDVRGATRMFNYWANASPGQHLHLVWREVILDARHNFHVNETGDPVEHTMNEGWNMVTRPGDNKIMYHRYEKDESGILKEVAVSDHIPLAEPALVTARDKAHLANHAAAVTPLNKTIWQLLPYTAGRNYITDKIWWNRQVIRTPYMMSPITVGFVFQGVGAGERSDNHVAVRKATQRAEDRFKLPMVHCFLHV